MYLIKRVDGPYFWNGMRWQRGEQYAKTYKLAALPDRLPIKARSKIFATRRTGTHLRYRLAGLWSQVIAECQPTLMRVLPDGRIDYGWICAACQQSNDKHRRKCMSCDTEKGSG